jgi:spore maturation protein SpmB
MFWIIFAMLLTLRILDYLNILKLIHLILRPLLTLLGLSREASTKVLVGLTLGISYGGGLIISEARSGRLSKRDIFIAMSFMGLSHALVEDTIIMLLIGANLSFVLGGRLIFSLITVFLLSQFYDYYLRRRSSKEIV